MLTSKELHSSLCVYPGSMSGNRSVLCVGSAEPSPDMNGVESVAC